MTTWRVAVLWSIVVAVIVLLGTSVPTHAQRKDAFRRALDFIPTESGQKLGLRGRIQLHSEPAGKVERILLHLEGREIAAGKKLTITALNPSVSPDPIVLGSITLAAQGRKVQADLVLGDKGGAPIPLGLSPIATLTEMRVREPGQQQGMLMYIVNHEYGSPEHSLPSLREWDLTPRPAAEAAGAQADVQTRTRSGGGQEFRVRVSANSFAPDTKVEVYFSHCCNGRGQFLAGTLQLKPRVKAKGVEAEAMFRNSKDQAMPVGASPVNGITAVWIVVEETQELLFAGAY